MIGRQTYRQMNRQKQTDRQMIDIDDREINIGVITRAGKHRLLDV